MTPAAIFGPVISCRSFEPHLVLFRDLLGLQPEGAPRALGASEVQALFGYSARSAQAQVLTTPGTDTGVVLLLLDPSPERCVRERSSALHADALKVIDFYAPDFERMLGHVRASGLSVEPDIAVYDLPEGRFQEAHLWAPDNVVLGLLGGPLRFFQRFATITDRMFSEVQSISTPVSDLPAVAAFYGEVLGLSTVYEYRITDPSFGELLGARDALDLRATNIGRRTEEPYFGLIDYGLAAGQTPSLRDHASTARRGIVGAVVLVADLQASLAAAQRRGDPHGDPVEIRLLDRAWLWTARVRAPHGVEHLLVQG